MAATSWRGIILAGGDFRGPRTGSSCGRFIPVHSDDALIIWSRKLLVAVLVLFPYLLFRFQQTFVRERTGWLRGIATILTAAAVLGALLLPRLPEQGEPRTPIFQDYVFLILVQWVFLSAAVAIGLWRGGRGQPAVARRRMRMLSLGALTLATLLVVAGLRSPTTEVGGFQIATRVFGILTAPLLLLGFAPPKWVTLLWRRPDEARLRHAEVELVKATSAEEIANGLLPHAIGLIGASGGLVYDHEIGTVAAVGLTESEAARFSLEARRRERTTDLEVRPDSLWVPFESGWLIFKTSPYTPFFGEEEANTLKALGVLTDLALARAELFEREKQQKESMRDFIAIASHDLRTPIAVIEGFTLTLSKQWDELSDEQKKTFLESMVRQLGQLKRLVDDLLMVSQIESGAISPQVEPADVEGAVSEVLEDLHEELGDIQSEIQPGLEVEVERDHLHRILSNYLRNAIVHGAPPITVRAHRQDGFVEIMVSDAGQGIAQEFLPRLFGKFERAERKTSKAVRGTGLGLSIVRGLARAAGGDAWYEPNTPSGATFGVRLPLREATYCRPQGGCYHKKTDSWDAELEDIPGHQDCAYARTNAQFIRGEPPSDTKSDSVCT